MLHLFINKCLDINLSEKEKYEYIIRINELVHFMFIWKLIIGDGNSYHVDDL